MITGIKFWSEQESRRDDRKYTIPSGFKTPFIRIHIYNHVILSGLTSIIQFKTYIFSISSSDFPFVSGSFSRINRKPEKQIIPYNQKVPLACNILFRIGKV